MTIFKLIKHQIFLYKNSIGLIIALSSFLIIGLVITCYYIGESIMIFTRDPVVLTEVPFYTGYFSNIGSVFWIGLFRLLLGLDDLFVARGTF